MISHGNYDKNLNTSKVLHVWLYVRLSNLIIPSRTVPQAPPAWDFLDFLHMIGAFPPQGLCLCCSLCLDMFPNILPMITFSRVDIPL